MSKDYYYTCGKCGLCFYIPKNNKIIKSKDLVIWIEDNNIMTWKPVRTPALGWNTLTLLEALTDSAKTYLSLENYDKTASQLNNLLKILRNKIKVAKREFRPLINRCEYKETKRTRCNRTPVEKINGIYLCKYHSKNQIKQPQITEFEVN